MATTNISQGLHIVVDNLQHIVRTVNPIDSFLQLRSRVLLGDTKRINNHHCRITAAISVVINGCLHREATHEHTTKQTYQGHVCNDRQTGVFIQNMADKAVQLPGNDR